MANKWIVHIKKTMKTMKSRGTYKKGMGLKQVIKEAKKTWHHAKKGGAEPEEDPMSVQPAAPMPEGGRRRKRGVTKRRKH
jgi:hypothetical protein